MFAARMSQMLGQILPANWINPSRRQKWKSAAACCGMEKDMTLQSVEKLSLNMAYYQLPTGVKMMEIPDMGKMPARQTSQPAQKEKDEC